MNLQAIILNRYEPENKKEVSKIFEGYFHSLKVSDILRPIS